MAAASRPRAEYTRRPLITLRRIFADYPGVEERRMFGCPAFFVKGRMFACLYGRALALKLSPARAAALLLKKHCRPFRPHGKSMTQWIEIRRARGADFRHDVDAILAAMRFVSRRAVREART